jgi:hypothetical protein
MFLDQVRSDHRVVMLPDAEYGPAGFTQHRVNLSVTTNVSINFGNPIIDIAAWLPIVLRAPVPEAAVDEHRDLCANEHHISRTANTGDWAPRNPITKAAPVQHRSESQLRLRVPAPISLHRLAGRRGGHIR